LASLGFVRRVPQAFTLVALTFLGCASEHDRSQFVADTDERSEALTASCPPNPDPNANPIQGIDISTYQTVSDWNAVAASEKFVIIKASQGTTGQDGKFASHRAGARGTNLKIGYYHYLNFSSSGAAQADNFLSVVGKIESDELPPMLDVEDSKSAAANSPAANLKIVLDWLAKVSAATGRKPMIYSGGGFWGGASFGNPPELQDYFFCWSRYSASNTCPQVPDNLVKQIKFWQFRADAYPGIPAGQTNGIAGAVDQDVFYGDAAAFNAFIADSGGAGPEYAAKYSKQSYPLAADGGAQVKVGEKVTGFIEMTNTGSATWKPGTVFLAPIPRDAASPYKADTWVSGTRISTVDKDIKPGEIGRFALDISGTTPGEGSLKMGWVAEGVTWFADGPKGGGPADAVAEVKVTVLPGDPKPGGGGAGGGAGASGSAAGGKGGAAGAAGSATGGKAGTGGAAGTATGNAGKGGASGAGNGGEAGKVGTGGRAQFAVDPSEPADSGCGCRTVSTDAGSGASRATSTLAALLAALAVARRRRGAKAVVSA
jgi:lysozyme